MSSFYNDDLGQQLFDFSMRPYEQPVTQIEMSDQIFFKSYKCHSLTIGVIKYYTVAKIVASSTLIYLNNNVEAYQQFNVWLSGLLAISFVQFIYCLYIGIIMQDLNVFIQSARYANHIRIFPPNGLPLNTIQAHVNQTYDFDGQLDIAANEQKIRNIISQIDDWIKQKYKLEWKKVYLILAYQTIQAFGFILYMNFDTTTIEGKFLVTILFLGIYQYLQIYLILIAVVIIIPIFIIVRLITKIYQRYKRYKLLKVLSQKKYSKSMQFQEECCSICLVDYEQEDKIIILPCNKNHNFHVDCIKNWIKMGQNSPTCPMCRRPIA